MTKNERTRSRGGGPAGNRQAQRKQGLPAALWLALGGLAVIIVGVLLIWQPGGATAPAVAPEVTGKPMLAVDREQIDFGIVPMNKLVRATFKLSNVGDRPLTINGVPQVQVVEGC